MSDEGLLVEESVHVIFDELGSMEDVSNKDDAELDELLQVQRDSPNKKVSGSYN